VNEQRLSESEKAYFAALVDSLGTFRVLRRNTPRGVHREIIMQFDGVSAAQVDWIKSRFRRARIVKREKKSLSSRVYFETRWAAEALVDASSYLLAKKSEVGLVFKFASAASKQGKRLTADQERTRAEVDLELEALKRGA